MCKQSAEHLSESNSLSDPSAKLESESLFGKLIISGKLMRGQANELMLANSALLIFTNRYNDQPVVQSLTLTTRLLFAAVVTTGFIITLTYPSSLVYYITLGIENSDKLFHERSVQERFSIVD